VGLLVDQLLTAIPGLNITPFADDLGMVILEFDSCNSPKKNSATSNASPKK